MKGSPLAVNLSKDLDFRSPHPGGCDALNGDGISLVEKPATRPPDQLLDSINVADTVFPGFKRFAFQPGEKVIDFLHNGVLQSCEIRFQAGDLL